MISTLLRCGQQHDKYPMRNLINLVEGLYGKDIPSMSLDDIEGEIDWMQGYFDDCEESGQGISSKESVYMRKLKDRRDELKAEKSGDESLDEALTLPNITIEFTDDERLRIEAMAVAFVREHGSDTIIQSILHKIGF